MFLKILVVNILVGACLLGAPLQVDQQVRRSHASLIVGDHEQALKEARACVEKFPDAPLSYEILIKSQSRAGLEKEMLSTWKTFHEKFPKEALAPFLLEEMCWGVLGKGWKSVGMSTKLVTLLGTAMTQDIRAVTVLKTAMNDSNSQIRAVAVQLSTHFGDASLKEEVLKLFHEEPSWEVRKELFSACAELKMSELLPELKKIVSDRKASVEEKQAAISAIMALKENVDRDELELLSKSDVLELRALAAKLIAKCQKSENGDLLLPLLKDFHPDVKGAALEAHAHLRLNYTDILKLESRNKDPKIGIRASFALLLSDPLLGEEAFSFWLSHDKKEVRRLSASALAKAGRFGVPLLREICAHTEDDFVRANAALGLLRQRVDVEKSTDILYSFLHVHKEKLMRETSFFNPLQKSTLSHHPVIANFPEAMNQVVRLEILNLLAICQHEKAEEAIKEFLKERSWEVVGLAAETLLGEGDESAIELIAGLLTDPDKEIRTGAALLLAVWGRDQKALPLLVEIYPDADRALQIKILEALGRVGDSGSIPFFIERLHESSQLLRVVAASMLIQTLNH